MFGLEGHFFYIYFVFGHLLWRPLNLSLNLEACHDLKEFGGLPFTYVYLSESSQALFYFGPLLTPSRDGKWLHTE